MTPPPVEFNALPLASAGIDFKGVRPAGVPRERVFRSHRIRIDRYAVKYLADANVLSEATRLAPNSRAIEWLRRNERAIAVDPVILGEIRFGIHLLPAGKRRRRLETWLDEGVARIVCVPWDAPTGLRWAKLLADLRLSGESIPVKDSLIAATALVHDMVVVARNTRDFRKAGVKVLDPFA